MQSLTDIFGKLFIKPFLRNELSHQKHLSICVCLKKDHRLMKFVPLNYNWWSLFLNICRDSLNLVKFQAVAWFAEISPRNRCKKLEFWPMRFTTTTGNGLWLISAVCPLYHRRIQGLTTSTGRVKSLDRVSFWRSQLQVSVAYSSLQFFLLRCE